MNNSTSKGRTNCPNCGAPIDTDVCPYCGTRFVDFAAMDTKEPFWMRVMTPRGVLTLRVRLQEVELRNPTEEVYSSFADQASYVEFRTRMMPEVTMRMSVLPTDGNVIYRVEELK